MDMLPIALAGLGGFLVYEKYFEHQPAKQPGTPTQQQSTSKFAPLTGAVSQSVVSGGSPKANASASPVGGGVPKIPVLNPSLLNGGASRFSYAVGGGAGAAQQLVDQTTAKVAAEYNKLSADAKKKGADLLNKALKPSPGLDGTENFEQATKKIAAAVGTAVGAAIGGPTGAALGAIAGAYLGDKLGPWLHDKWSDLESWTKSKLNTVEDWAKNEVQKGEDWAKSEVQQAWDTVASWF